MLKKLVLASCFIVMSKLVIAVEYPNREISLEEHQKCILIHQISQKYRIAACSHCPRFDIYCPLAKKENENHKKKLLTNCKIR